MRKKFETFKSGDIVRVKKDFPYVNHILLDGEIYTIDKMLSDAGIVTLKGFPFNVTFPEDAFELLYNGDMSDKE